MTHSGSDPDRCLADEDLTDYLEGGLSPSTKARTEAHLVACDPCRKRLASFIKLLSKEITSSEEIALVGIQQAWNRAQRDSRLPSPVSRYRKLKMTLVSVLAVLVLAAGARTIMDYRAEPRSAREVIHLLLADSRPFEPRMSDQPFLPYSAKRGASDAGVDELLVGQMNRLGATAYEMGQFQLLQKDFGSAIKYLELAVKESQATASTHNDLGVAYLQSGDPLNEARAAEEFHRALAIKSDFAPAAFNLAIVYERMGKTDEAESQWTHYLALEADGAWKDEAKSKLEAVKSFNHE